MRDFVRKAEWVWVRPPRQGVDPFAPRLPGKEEAGRPGASGTGTFAYFRRSFDLDKAPGSAIAWTSADGRYRLHVNGLLVGRGPARCHPARQCVDRYEIGSLLRPGRNVIAILARSYGGHTSWYEAAPESQSMYFGAGGLYFQADLDSPEAPDLNTGRAWTCRLSTAWEGGAATGGTGSAEDYRPAEEPAGWMEAGFEDSSWSPACELRLPSSLGGSDIVPFPLMVPREVPSLVEDEVFPLGKTRIGAGRKARAEELIAKFHSGRPARIGDDDDEGRPTRGLSGQGPWLVAEGGDACAIGVFDFERIELGRLRLALECEGESELLFAVGEALDAEGRVEIPDEVAGISTPLVHRLRLPAGRWDFEQFDASGCRYVELHLSSSSRAAINRLSLAAVSSPRSLGGRFSSSDRELNLIWVAGLHTALTCRQDGFIDCPGREQRQWMGDGYVQALVGYMIEADPALARRYLMLAAETQRPDGMIAVATSCDLEAEGRVVIPDFCLLWILAVERYFLHTGDRATARKLLPHIHEALAWFGSFVGEAGLLEDVPGWTFIDWAEALERRGTVTALNALYCAALRSACDLAAGCGLRHRDPELKARALRIEEGLNARLWNEGRGAYCDALVDGIPSPIVSQHANSLMVCMGIAPRGRWARILGTILDDRHVRLTRSWQWDDERPFDPGSDVVLAQPFYSHFLHAALRRAGRTKELVGNIKARWSGMASTDGSFWESWQLTAHTSRCHGFSATPVYDIASSVLGVRPLLPGYSRFEVRPWLEGLQRAEGEVPTPAGLISIAWETSREGAELRVSTPPGLRGLLRLPARYKPARVELEGGSHIIKSLRKAGS